MDDGQILHRIDELVAEEHGLRSRRLAGEVDSDTERQRLSELEVTLDQCWDLLRRRRAQRDAGGDPDSAEAADVRQVEGYLQ
jgi:Protein of unknown function (DUF2630)